MLRVRAGAEEPRRAADGGGPSSEAGWVDRARSPLRYTCAQAALPWGARQGTGPFGSGRCQPQHPAALIDCSLLAAASLPALASSSWGSQQAQRSSRGGGARRGGPSLQ